MPSIQKVVDRSKLKPRREPYWAKISKGCYLGYRKMAAGHEGTWIARAFDEAEGKQNYKALGAFSELAEHQRYDAAQKEAAVWFDHLGKGGSATLYTVAKSCAAYVNHLRKTKGEKAAADVEARFKNYVLNDKRLAGTELGKLTPHHLERWKDALRHRPTKSGGNRGSERSDSTLNRDMTCFRAALNLALEDNHVTTDAAWRGKLKPIQGADRRRELYLTKEQRRALINAAAADLQGFLLALTQVPLRPGAMAGLKVADYDRRTQTLTIGIDKAGKGRKVGLPPATATLFERLCKGKLPGAPILSRADGSQWNKDAWKKPVKAAAKAAKLLDSVVIYALRHSAITDLVQSNQLSLLTIAQLSGTSVRMIEQHYGHLTQEHARAGLAQLAL